jgi:NTE family protein
VGPLFQLVSWSAAAQSGAHNREQDGIVVVRVLEVVSEVGVKGDAVPGDELIAGPVAVQNDLPRLHQSGLPAAGLVHRGIPGTAGDRPRRKGVAGELGSLAGQRGGEDLIAMPGRPVGARAALVMANDLDRPRLVEAQQLGEAQVKASGDALSDLQRGRRLPALDLREHRRAHAAAVGEVAQRQVHALAQGANAAPQSAGGGAGIAQGRHHRLYAITYNRPLGAGGLPATPASLRFVRTRPDVLVLGGGGVLGEAWMMGVLAGIEDAAGFDLRECDSFVGTSAGSIVAAHLVAGNSPRRPSSVGTDIELGTGAPARGLAVAAVAAARRAGGAALAASATFAPLALGVAAPGGAVIRALLLRGLPKPPDTLSVLRSQVERSGARFDGRLRVAAVDRRTGRRVVFGSPRSPSASVAEAVAASCTVPWLFAPVRIGDREYVDGGVWSPTNLDAAPAGRDTQVLCLNPTASLASSHRMLTVMRNVARSAASIEALALRRRGARVQTIAPNAECAAVMGSNFMDQEPRSRVLSAAYRQGLLVAAVRRGW